MYDKDVTRLLTSQEAEKACSKIWLIYTRLKELDWKLWERPGVLYVSGNGDRTAWEILCDLAGVASGTLNKALKWMAEQRVIAYFARKNGVGIRIYFNLALNSIKPKEKNLRLVPTSSGDAPASANEAPSCDSKAITKNIQDSDKRADARDEEPPAAQSPDLPLPSTRPPLQLVPPMTAPASLSVPESLLRKVEQLEQVVRDVARSVPSKDFLLNQVAGKIGRTAAETVLRMEGRNKSNNAYVGAAPPTTPSTPFIPPAHSEFWKAQLPQIAAVVGAENCASWFTPLNVIEHDGQHTIIAPDPVFRDWIESNYADVAKNVGLTNCQWQFTNNERDL